MGLSATTKIIRSFVQPGKSIFRTGNGIGCCCWKLSEAEIKTGKITQETEALIGDLSFAAAENAASKFADAFADIQYMFDGLPGIKKVLGRPKSALSSFTKIKRNILKEGGVENLENAIKFVGDAEGTRLILNSLPKLSPKDISNLISKTRIDGKPLTNRQINLLKKYIYEEPIEANRQIEAFKLYKEFTKPLIEQHSQNAIDNLTMSALAYRIKNEGLTITQIKNEGILDSTLLSNLEQRIATGDIAPLKIIEINNYRGAHGIAQFSDSQMAQLNYAMGFKTTITKRKATSSRYSYLQDSPVNAKDFRYKEPDKAIKASGYRTGQMNVEHANGALGELQVRGELTNEWAEIEHIAYDLRQGKNTLGEAYNEYASVVSKISDQDYARYNTYLENWYNYFHRLEIGLPAKKPKLPEGLNPILSMENMQALHTKGEYAVIRAKKNFSPYEETVEENVKFKLIA